MPYHTNEDLRVAVEGFARSVGERAELREIGRTVEGRAIQAVTLAAPGRQPDAARLQALVTANIHGNEVIGSEVALGILELLADGRAPAAAALVELADVTVVPAVNLDTRAAAAATLAAGSAWSAFAVPPRGNRHGVDLNRNFPPPAGVRPHWSPLAGTSLRLLPWYRGPAPLSEPESRALAELAARLRPVAAVNLHSIGRLFLYPSAYTAAPPDDLVSFLAMADAFGRSQPRHRYKVRQSHALYAIVGDLDDWLYETHGTLSVTVELSWPQAGTGGDLRRLACPLAWMNPRRPEPTIENTASSCLAALAEASRRASAAASRSTGSWRSSSKAPRSRASSSRT